MNVLEFLATAAGYVIGVLAVHGIKRLLVRGGRLLRLHYLRRRAIRRLAAR